MSRFWSPFVSGLTPYVPGEQPKLPNLIKLNTNENPFGPSPKVLEAIRSAVDDTLRLYPDPAASDLKHAVAEYHGMKPTEVFGGNGSDEVLALVFMALLKHEAPLLFPDITYSFYTVYCSLYGIEYRTIPVDQDMAVRLDDYGGPCGGIIFPNPNAPTGVYLKPAAIEMLLIQHPDVVIVVDEAYIDFGGESVLPLTRQYSNLLVVQTLSKSRSLAGLRVGIAIGHPELIEALERVKNSFNSYPLDRLAIVGAIASYRDDAYFQKVRCATIQAREGLVTQLNALGFLVLPSLANFVFARHPSHDAAKLAAGLRERSIIVRHFNQPRITQHLRISVGNPFECTVLIDALTELIGRGSNSNC